MERITVAATGTGESQGSWVGVGEEAAPRWVGRGGSIRTNDSREGHSKGKRC